MTEIKHIINQVELELLAAELGVRSDWHEPDEQGLTLDFNGKSFDNAGIWGHKIAIEPNSLEQYITLKKDDMPIAEINMATLLSWASNHELKEHKPASTEGKECTIELEEVFDTDGFRDFLYDLLCDSETTEYIHIVGLTPVTAAVCAFSNMAPVHRSWSTAQYDEDKSVIEVITRNGVYEYVCTGYEEAVEEIQKLIYNKAEDISSISDLFELLNEQVHIDAVDLIRDALHHNHSIPFNPYDLLCDLQVDADGILNDAIDDAVGDAEDDILINVAESHLDIGSEEICKAAFDSSMDGSEYIKIAKAMNIDLADNMRHILEQN